MRRSGEHELTEARYITSMLFTMTRHVSAHKANWANDIWVASSFQKIQLEYKFTVMWHYQVNSGLVSGMLLSLTKCICYISLWYNKRYTFINNLTILSDKKHFRMKFSKLKLITENGNGSQLMVYIMFQSHSGINSSINNTTPTEKSALQWNIKI